MANVYPNVISLAIIAEGLANIRPRINEGDGFEETTTDLVDTARIAISTLRGEEAPPDAPISSGTIFVRTDLLVLLRSLLSGSLADAAIAGWLPAALDTDYAAAVAALDAITLPPPPPPPPPGP